MAKKSHPYIEAVKVSALIFGVSVLIIYFVAAFVSAAVRDSRQIAPAQVEQNIAPPGRLYSR